jgi:aspartate/methionine/tyrosine aminotransferase
MKIEKFEMERMQSAWENVVDYNLSESGVHPLSLSELANEGELREILETGLGYSQTNGTPELRREIAKLYPGATIDQVMATSGSSEANFLLMWRLIEPGDEVVFMMPNYMQMHGLVRAFGARLKPLWLRESLGWSPDLDELRHIITKKTKLIIVTNPNNPSGSVLNQEAMAAIVDCAARVRAWIIADEVYQGAEREGETTPSFWGTHDKVVIVNGLSKAYGIPGVRIGWIVGPEELVQDTWPYHDYTTISPSILSDRLARIALAPAMREKILKRTQAVLQKNFPLLNAWLESLDGFFDFIPPRAGAIAFTRYHHPVNSTDLVTRLIREKSVLIVPGDHFEMDQHLRFGFGSEPGYLERGLARIKEFLQDIRKK